MRAHAPVSGSDTTYWTAQVRHSKNPATSGSHCALARAGRDGGKLSMVHPSGVWGSVPHVLTNETCTSDGLGEAAGTRSPAVTSDASEVSLASGLGDDADVRLRGLPALRIELL